MKIALRLAAVSVLACIFSSCASHPPDEAFFVRQKIPIEIQSGKPVTIEIRTPSPSGESEVGIRCSPEVWNALTNGTGSITVQLISSNKKGIQIARIPPGYDAQCPIKSFYDLFYLYGMYQFFPRATVQITFPNAPSGVTHAEIFVCRTPRDNL